MMTQPMRWLVSAIGGVAGLILIVLLGSLPLIESEEVADETPPVAVRLDPIDGGCDSTGARDRRSVYADSGSRA